MDRTNVTNQLARLYKRSLFVQDKEIEESIENLEARIRLAFPRDFKQIEAYALNLALGEGSRGPFPSK